MSGLLNALRSSALTVQAHSKSVEVAGRNIAHMNDPTRARQRVVYGSMGQVNSAQGPQSSALTAVGFEHIRDTLLDKQLLAEISSEKGLEQGNFRMMQILTSLGEYLNRSGEAQFIDEIAETGGGIRETLTAFFNAFESFSARPNDPTTKQVLLQKANAVVDEFSRIHSRLGNVETTLNDQINDEVATINHNLQSLHQLNQEIAKLEIGRPGSALDLRDQRQAKLEELAQSLNFTTSEETGDLGRITITVQNDDGSSTTLVGPGTDPKLLSVDDSGQITLQSNPSAILTIDQGVLPALLEVRDNQLAQVKNEIETIATVLAREVNNIYQATGIDFFDADAALEGQLMLSADLDFTTLQASATGLSGANEIAVAITALASSSIAEFDGNTFSQFSTRIVTNLAQEINNRQNRQEVQTAVRQLIQNRRDEISGVSLDEEITNMLQFQRAFQAASRVFNVMDEMLRSLVNELGNR